MKKLMLVGLLMALISMSSSNALAQNAGPSNLGNSGAYYYFPVAPSLYGGFDSILFLSSFFNPVTLEINTAGLLNLPGSPVQQTNVDIPVPFSSAVVTPRPTPGAPSFQCTAPPANLCQLFIHHRVPPTSVVNAQFFNFTATLLVTNNNESFQFVAPYFFVIP